MKVTIREQGDIAIFDIRGQLLSGPDGDFFLALVNGSLREGRQRILVNLNEVKWIDGYGLGILLKAFKATCNAGGKLKLLAVNERVRSILAVTQLASLFDIYAGEDEAMASFSQATALSADGAAATRGTHGGGAAGRDLNSP